MHPPFCMLCPSLVPDEVYKLSIYEYVTYLGRWYKESTYSPDELTHGRSPCRLPKPEEDVQKIEVVDMKSKVQ